MKQVLIVLILVSKLCWAQGNLILYPSFELVAPSWSSVFPTTPDYFTANLPPPPLHFYSAPRNINGYQEAKTGIAYMGIITYWVIPEDGPILDSGTYYVEYFKTFLNQALKPNACYQSGLHFVNGNYNKRFVNRLGIYFTEELPTKTNTLDIQFSEVLRPQIELDSTKFFTDTLNWMNLDGVFKAKGGEKYILYGNFYPKERTQYLAKTPMTNGPLSFQNDPYMDSLYAYVFIDDVYLYEIPSAQASHDTAICIGQSKGIGLNNDTTTATYNWLPATGLDCTSCPNPIATPNSNVTYTLTKTVRGCSTQAKVSVTVNPKPQVVLNLSQTQFCVDNASLILQGSPSGGSFQITGPAHSVNADVFTANEAGLFQFQYHYSDANTCSNSSTVKTLTVYPLPAKPQINRKDTLLCVSRSSVTLSALPEGGTYSGEGLNGAVIKPNAPFATLVFYTVTDNNSCSNADTVFINVQDCAQGKFSIPNVFSPNGDGVNEQWKFELPYGVTFTSLQIYDRWGNQVFERSGEQFPNTSVLLWDGYTTSALPCDEGTYFYILHTQNESEGPKLNEGVITLRR